LIAKAQLPNFIEQRNRSEAEGTQNTAASETPLTLVTILQTPKHCTMTKKERFKAGLYFGVSMMLFYIIQNFVTTDIDSAFVVVKMIVSGLVGGAVAGVLFGWLMGPLTKLFTVKTDLLLNDKEHIIYETPANHYKGLEAVGGKLLLTNERLIFKSHRINIQNHQLSIDLARLVKIDRFKNLGLVNNGISVTTESGTTEKFVVSNVEEWLRRLSSLNGLQYEAGASGV
jgi:hypothetical protein